MSYAFTAAQSLRGGVGRSCYPAHRQSPTVALLATTPEIRVSPQALPSFRVQWPSSPTRAGHRRPHPAGVARRVARSLEAASVTRLQPDRSPPRVFGRFPGPPCHFGAEASLHWSIRAVRCAPPIVRVGRRNRRLRADTAGPPPHRFPAARRRITLLEGSK